MSQKIHVEVVYATFNVQKLVSVCVGQEATLHEAIRLSGLLEDYPEIDLALNRIGVFGQVRPLHDKAVEGDRIEIYRPLVADPKEARRRRARKRGD
ncbi:MAG: RnfH family protein [Proteobacteria bacterium]|nr:RnfH family protein [Pseudomonadota bacterium]MDE3208039.1 RnfH family protein [Pseudomonadota bacterium]